MELGYSIQSESKEEVKDTVIRYIKVTGNNPTVLPLAKDGTTLVLKKGEGWRTW